MNNLWNRSVGPFDEAAVQRHRHMGLLDCNGDVNADAVNFLAHLCAGLFFDALCDSYVEMQTVSRICQAFCKSENVEAQRVVLMICSEYGDLYRYTVEYPAASSCQKRGGLPRYFNFPCCYRSCNYCRCTHLALPQETPRGYSLSRRFFRGGR